MLRRQALKAGMEKFRLVGKHLVDEIQGQIDRISNTHVAHVTKCLRGNKYSLRRTWSGIHENTLVGQTRG